MTGKKETGATWHHTTVVLQSDIYQQALVQGNDISDACNRALAGAEQAGQREIRTGVVGERESADKAVSEARKRHRLKNSQV